MELHLVYLALGLIFGCAFTVREQRKAASDAVGKVLDLMMSSLGIMQAEDARRQQQRQAEANVEGAVKMTNSINEKLEKLIDAIMKARQPR